MPVTTSISHLKAPHLCLDKTYFWKGMSRGNLFQGLPRKASLVYKQQRGRKRTSKAKNARGLLSPGCSASCTRAGWERGLWHMKMQPDHANTGSVVSLNLPSGVTIEQITPQMCFFKQTTFSPYPSFFFSLKKEMPAKDPNRLKLTSN